MSGADEVASYRIYLCSVAGNRVAADDFDAVNDDDAIPRARQIARRIGALRFEVWLADRNVFTCDGDDPQS